VAVLDCLEVASSCIAPSLALEIEHSDGMSSVRRLVPLRFEASRSLADLVAQSENVVRQLRESKPVWAPIVDRGGLMVVGAVYSLDTGKVAWLPDNQAKRAERLEPPRESAQCAGSRGTRTND